MSINRYNPQTDKAQKDIVLALRKLGYSVEIIKLPLDLLIGKNGINVLIEIKNPKAVGQTAGKLSEKQEKFFQTWQGQCAVASSIEEVLINLKALGV